MSVMELPTKIETSDRVVTVSYDFGDNLQEMLKLFGEAVVYSHAKANMKVHIRAIVKSGMKATKERAPLTDAEIQAKIAGHVIGIAPERSPETKEKKIKSYHATAASMTAEEVEDEIKKLKALIAAKKKAAA